MVLQLRHNVWKLTKHHALKAFPWKEYFLHKVHNLFAFTARRQTSRKCVFMTKTTFILWSCELKNAVGKHPWKNTVKWFGGDKSVQFISTYTNTNRVLQALLSQMGTSDRSWFDLFWVNAIAGSWTCLVHDLNHTCSQPHIWHNSLCFGVKTSFCVIWQRRGTNYGIWWFTATLYKYDSCNAIGAD